MRVPKISILTATYNQGRFIEQTICSVLGQSYPNLEYIIIDGGSTDETIQIIEKYQKHLAYWVSTPDNGQTDAINRGFQRCTGEIFNWINSDDYYEHGTFKKLACYFADPAVDVVCGKEWGFTDGAPDERVAHPGSIIKSTACETIRTGIIDQPCTFFRRERIAPFFPLNASLRYVMDRQLWWHYLLRYGLSGIRQVNDVFTHFRIHQASKSVGEAAGFEVEFDRLKESLFRQLQAPPVLQRMVETGHESLSIDWSVQPEQRDALITAFACEYARRQYVQKDRDNLRQLTSLVKKGKAWRMNATEWKWWLTAHVLPEPIFRYRKQKTGLCE